MITAVCDFTLRADLSQEQALAEMQESIPVYQGRPGLMRKYICINLSQKRGCGIYLWSDRQSADTYFAEFLPIMREQLGIEPVVTFFDTPGVVDNMTGEVQIVV